MSSAPGSRLLRPGERELFIEEFEKDLKFLQVFMLLMNRSCPIRNVDLVWVENGPSGRSGWRHMGIIEALGGPCSRLLRCTPGNPHRVFCNIVNDCGLKEADSCGLGLARWDLALIKRFQIRERASAQFRAECFNAWNHANLTAPNLAPANTSFGAITKTSGLPRQFQFALKLSF